MSIVTALLKVMGGEDARRENAEKLAITGLVDTLENAPGWAGEQRRQIALRHAMFRAAMVGLMEVLGGDIRYVLLKGEPLARTLYDDPSLRSSTDLDLLVLPGDYEEVRRRLIDLGYVPKRPEGPRMWAFNQEEFRHGVHGAAVEIHWMLALPALPRMSLLPIFETRQSFALDDDLEVFVLRSDWMGIHLALHFQQHTGFAKGLLDIAAWCDRIACGLERRAFLEKTRRLRLEGLMQWPLHTIERLCGERPPMYVADVDRTVRTWAAISAFALRDCLSRKFTGGVRDSLAALNPTVGPELSVPIHALTMAVVDGGASDKMRSVAKPILDGPHFVGRAMRRWGVMR